MGVPRLGLVSETATQAPLSTRRPQVDASRLVGELVPPPRFDVVRFSTYRPDPAQPSQAAAVQRLQECAVRAALWRRAQGVAPIVPFPGWVPPSEPGSTPG